ncbi:type IV pilus biogenesis/stability protein PilW [Ferrimonas sediminicola]|uniref:Type IV pilus biogenesis/stability protein PilW n=1 Tax=Ferrimonas sediminicola TaxID=2569538 RepID=A0A4U1BK37_9GAMM|nr:type IV pilus biogenesis/stability protein PilW [Ferrimonas sediminicola]TKB51555.1 type IV pilus biogenesis/stability protein PilW [Ferrimonas sediminicola]
MKAWIALGCVALLVACVTQTTLDGREVATGDPILDAQEAARERVALAVGYLKRGDMEAARRNLERALEHDGDSEQGHLTLAYYYEQVGDLSAARQIYEGLLKLYPGSADVHNNYGVFLCRRSEFDRSQEQLLAAIATPGYAQQGSSYENLARCALKVGRQTLAVQYFHSALKYDPGRIDLWLELAELSFRLQDYPQARSALSHYHGAAAATAPSLWLGVEIESRAQQWQAARQFGAQLLVKYPDSEQAKAYRAKNYQ